MAALRFVLPWALLGLAAIWLGAYGVGMALGKTTQNRWRRLARPAKLVMIGCTLGSAALWWIGVAMASPAASRYAPWIAGGLVAGALGDLILADVLPFREPVIPGMVAFAAGHLFYLAAILSEGRFLPWQPLSFLILGGALLGAMLLWRLLVYNPRESRPLNAGSLIYTMLLVGITALANLSGLVSLGAGMILFGVSDVLLSQSLIRHRGFPLIHDVVWILYSAGQMLIAFSIAEAATVAAV
jgi:hypothetical protein